MIYPQYFEGVKDKNCFTRQEVLDSFRKGGFELSDASFCKRLSEIIKEGNLVKIGRGLYCFHSSKMNQYKHVYSDYAEKIAGLIKKRYPLLNFSIMELTQLNDFINHQIAHNTLFVSTEADFMDFVFETLKERYFGKILIDPTSEIYHRYWSDGVIIVNRLVTEAPKGLDVFWHTRLEKLLVDVVADSLISGSISESELPNIFEYAFCTYAVDENCLFRYASRRGMKQKIKNLIKEKTNIKLLTEV